MTFFLSFVKKLCYVAADYEAELRKDTNASCEVDGEGWFTLSEERFKTTEILFQPHIGGMYVILHMGLFVNHAFIHNSVMVAQC
jgi:actin-related protein 8, plant